MRTPKTSYIVAFTTLAAAIFCFIGFVDPGGAEFDAKMGQLVAQGQLIDAHVVRIRYGKANYVDYSFDVQGQQYTGTLKADENDGALPAIGSGLKATFLPSDPTLSTIRPKRQLSAHMATVLAAKIASCMLFGLSALLAVLWHRQGRPS